MSKPDDRKVILAEFFAGKQNSVGDYWYIGMVKDAHESLLAEAESAANNLHTNLIAAYAERDSLQSRLDAVGALVVKWDAAQKQAHPYGYHEGRVPTDEIRAALGGESPASEEESK